MGNKLHVLEAHRITSGDDVLVAVIDSKIDMKHPEFRASSMRSEPGSSTRWP